VAVTQKVPRAQTSAKARIKALLPPVLQQVLRRVRVSVGLCRAYRYDRLRFLRFSSALGYASNRHNLASRITGSYHGVEKGLALPDPRPGFGSAALGQLIDCLDEYLARYGDDGVTRAAQGALVAYLEFNRSSGLPDEQVPHLSALLRLTRTQDGVSQAGGTKIVRREQIAAAVSCVTADFFATRSSVRQFAPGAVSEEHIEFAVKAAQKSPAVCNRQFQRVYVISDPTDVRRALELQGGARGFAHQVPMVAVITSNLRSYWGGGERMQAWTDGGMFAMSFLLGLHACGVGSVCLNWSKTEALDREFHHVFGLPEEEAIVMLIGFGGLKEEYRVAASPRPALSATYHKLSTQVDDAAAGPAADDVH